MPKNLPKRSEVNYFVLKGQIISCFKFIFDNRVLRCPTILYEHAGGRSNVKHYAKVFLEVHSYSDRTELKILVWFGLVFCHGKCEVYFPYNI